MSLTMIGLNYSRKSFPIFPILYQGVPFGRGTNKAQLFFQKIFVKREDSGSMVGDC